MSENNKNVMKNLFRRMLEGLIQSAIEGGVHEDDIREVVVNAASSLRYKIVGPIREKE